MRLNFDGSNHWEHSDLDFREWRVIPTFRKCVPLFLNDSRRYEICKKIQDRELLRQKMPKTRPFPSSSPQPMVELRNTLPPIRTPRILNTHKTLLQMRTELLINMQKQQAYAHHVLVVFKYWFLNLSSSVQLRDKARA